MFTIPDKGEGLHDNQSILFQEYIDVLVAGISSVDCVLSGCGVTAQATPDMTVAVAAGSVRTNGAVKAVAAANATITAADATNPRFDFVVIDSAGAIAVRAGTAAAAPKPPARTANDVALAVVYVPAGDAAINANQIVDMRTVRQESVVMQMVHLDTGALATGTTVIPIDDTIPQNTEGDEYMSLSITPKYATSTLVVDVVFNGSNGTADRWITVALFRDAGADAIGATVQYSELATEIHSYSFSVKVPALAASATTFKVRAGANGTGTTTFNGKSGARSLGGVMASSIRITEIA